MQQGLKFKTIDDFLTYLPDRELEIVEALREIALDSIPDCMEKLSYNVPYYFRHSRICFIWPASVPWGKVKTEGVLFGFCNGYLLADEYGYFDKGRREQVYSKTFNALADIEADLLKSYLFDAVIVDEELKRSKRNRG